MVCRQHKILCRPVRQGEHSGSASAQGRGNAAHTRHARSDSQGRAQAQETGGTGEETLPQETCRHRKTLCR